MPVGLNNPHPFGLGDEGGGGRGGGGCTSLHIRRHPGPGLSPSHNLKHPKPHTSASIAPPPSAPVVRAATPPPILQSAGSNTRTTHGAFVKRRICACFRRKSAFARQKNSVSGETRRASSADGSLSTPVCRERAIDGHKGDMRSSRVRRRDGVGWDVGRGARGVW